MFRKTATGGHSHSMSCALLGVGRAGERVEEPLARVDVGQRDIVVVENRPTTSCSSTATTLESTPPESP